MPVEECLATFQALADEETPMSKKTKKKGMALRKVRRSCQLAEFLRREQIDMIGQRAAILRRQPRSSGTRSQLRSIQVGL